MRRSTSLHALLFAGSVIATAVRAVNVSGPTVTLDPLNVVAAPDYRPIEKNWQVGRVPGLLIFSHGNSTVKPVTEQLQLVRAAFGLVWRDETLLVRPMTVVITADEAEFQAWTGVAPFSMDMTLRTVATPSGPVLVVNGGDDDVHRVVGRGYVLAHLRETKLPRWVQEGLAQVVNSAEAEGDRLRVGRIQQDPRNAVSAETLRTLDIAMRLSGPAEGGSGRVNLINLRGEKMRVEMDNVVPTWSEFQKYLDDETQRRLQERDTYMATGDFASFLDDNRVMPLDKVFDPLTPDTVAWRMNAWGFTHYSLFGEKQSRQPKFFQFVQQLERQPARAPVEVFEEVYQLPPRKFAQYLSLYAKLGNYRYFNFKLAAPFKGVQPEMVAAPEATVLPLRARVLAATDRAEAARKLLAQGYANPANRTPAYISQLAAFERAHDPERAAELLEDAARRDRLDNFGRRQLAAIRLARLQGTAAKHSLEDLSPVLMPLYIALEKGDQSEELFLLAGKAWTISASPPTSEHLDVLRLGLSCHPESRELAELLKQLEQHS